MSTGNYIKIDRKILEWEWYHDVNTTRVFLHLLLKANWKDGAFQGIEVTRGSLVSSIRKLAEETGLTEKEVRTALNHLKRTHEVASKSHTKFTVFTIKNYNVYQTMGTQNGEQGADKGQTEGEQRATIEERKKENKKEGKNINTICSELDISTPNSKVAGAFLLNDGSLYNVTENDVERFQQLYPGIDCRAELRKVIGWCEANPRNRKTRNGAKRFLNGWMARKQDRGGNRQQGNSSVESSGEKTESTADYYKRLLGET